ncbi:hypothetical protein ABV409_15070 [Flagellimonas sp. DF-77]|uniref:Crp/Fnr family transcriptional regulator n=1 Tax=Flagellimonas algarum TaxID=3230298 RepID=UPI003395D44A
MRLLDTFYERLKDQFDIPAGFWDELVDCAKIIHLRKDEVLVPYSSKKKAAYLILQGSLKQSIIDSNGEKSATWFFFEHVSNVAICFDSYFLDEYTKYEISALESSVVCQISRSKIEDWADRFPTFNRFYREDCIKSFILSVEIRNYMISHTPVEFLEYLREAQPEFIAKVPSKYLADFMGITPEWLSKMNRMLAKGQA